MSDSEAAEDVLPMNSAMELIGVPALILPTFGTV